MSRVSAETREVIESVKVSIDNLAQQVFAEVVLLQEKNIKGLSAKLSKLANKLQDFANK